MFTALLGRGRIPEATNYDGSDYAAAPILKGISDGKAGTVSTFVNIDTVQNFGILTAVDGGVINFDFKFENQNFKVEGYNVAGTRILNVISNSTYTSGSWIHVIASWDLATTTAHLYIGDADDEAAGSTVTNDTIDYTITPAASSAWHVGTSFAGSSTKLDGCLSELWFNTEFVDISVTANRRKFITAAGKPADLGADGSTPTGSRPLIYAPSGNPHFNRGTSGPFTQQSKVEACGTSPHD